MRPHMADPAPHDSALASLVSAAIPSNVAAGVSYRLGRMLVEGEASVAFLGQRCAPEGDCPVVVKLFLPSFVRDSAEAAMLALHKDAARLGRLGARVPPSPFVVRSLDVGTVALPDRGGTLDLPWLAAERVHGGAEGVTLVERVARCLEWGGYAFDPARAARAIDCIARGLAAMHDEGVIHRDFRPGKVLCCGFGHEEIFKVGGFGIARPSSLSRRFGGLTVGAPGYAAPELAGDLGKPGEMGVRDIGPWTDVFGFACVVYYLLTGEPYFLPPSDDDGPAALAGLAVGSRRRSITDTSGLSPEIGDREAACRAIDEALAWGTSPKREERPLGPRALAATLLPWLRLDARRARPAPRRLEAVLATGSSSPPPDETWQWIAPHGPRGDRVLRYVSWDGDGHCLAATDRGLSFWNGMVWRDAPLEGLPDPAGIRFVRRVAPGRWLVGGDAATFAVYTAEGVSEVVRGADPSVRFDLFSGDLDDLAVFVGVVGDGAPALYALAGRRWLKPLPLDGVAALSSIARVGDALWLIAGRTTDRQGFVATYAPLEWDVSRVATPPVRAFLRCAGHPDRQVGVAAGADGVLVWYERSPAEGDAGPARAASVETVAGGMDLSAAAVDVMGRGWVAGAGRILVRDPETHLASPWRVAWTDSAWSVPIVSMFADVGLVIALTANGGVIEGRAP